MTLHGSRSRLLLALATAVSALIVAVAPAVGAGTASATILESPACTFLVRYQWFAFGGGPNVEAHVQLWRRDAGTGDTSIVGGDFLAPDANGKGGTITHSPVPDGGQTTAHTYFAQGYLTQKNGNVVRGSLAVSDDTAAAEVCS